MKRKISYNDYAYLLGLKKKNYFLKIFGKFFLEKGENGFYYVYVNLFFPLQIIIFPLSIFVDLIDCIWNRGLKYFSFDYSFAPEKFTISEYTTRPENEIEEIYNRGK